MARFIEFPYSLRYSSYSCFIFFKKKIHYN